MADALIACGRVGRPHGVRGELRLWPLNVDTDLITVGRVLRLGARPDQTVGYPIESVRRDAKGPIVRFVGVEDRDGAAALTSAQWFEARDAFSAPTPDEVYVADLLGLAVQTEAGEDVGRIADVWQVGAADVLVIRGPTGEHLVPNVPEFVVRLDPEAGAAIVRPIPGLLSGVDAETDGEG